MCHSGDLKPPESLSKSLLITAPILGTGEKIICATHYSNEQGRVQNLLYNIDDAFCN